MKSLVLINSRCSFPFFLKSCVFSLPTPPPLGDQTCIIIHCIIIKYGQDLFCPFLVKLIICIKKRKLDHNFLNTEFRSSLRTVGLIGWQAIIDNKDSPTCVDNNVLLLLSKQAEIFSINF